MTFLPRLCSTARLQCMFFSCPATARLRPVQAAVAQPACDSLLDRHEAKAALVVRHTPPDVPLEVLHCSTPLTLISTQYQAGHVWTTISTTLSATDTHFVHERIRNTFTVYCIFALNNKPQHTKSGCFIPKQRHFRRT